MDKMTIRDTFDGALERAAGELDQLLPVGTYRAVCYDKDGNEKWTEDFTNLVVNEGKNEILGVMFNAVSATTWYIGLINNSPSPTILATNTMSTGSRNWSEEHTNYSQATRPTWTPLSVASQSITNTATVDFSFTGSVTIYGIFLSNNNTKNGTSGKMWCAGAFSSPRAVVNGDTLKVTYTLSL